LVRLPGAEKIVDAYGRGQDYDTVVAVDASSADRMGAVYREEDRGAPLLVIDHHVTNTRFGTHNWVAPSDAATCQMLVRLADAVGAPLTPPLAQCLLTGVVTDTLCFRTTNTTPDVLATAMRLMQAGGNLTEITENVFDQRPFSVIRLWGTVLDEARFEEGVIWVALPRTSMESAGSESDEDGSLSSMLIRTMGAEISATFLEKRDRKGAPAVECSFRARSGRDISGVATRLGGGGHPQASGCTVPGTLADVIALVVPMLKAARRQQSND
jgi:phosphoesterase RecJ-like protein